MPHGTRAFFYHYSLGTDLNEWPLKCRHLGAFIFCRQLGTTIHWGQTLMTSRWGDSLYVPAVWDDPLMSDAPRGVK